MNTRNLFVDLSDLVLFAKYSDNVSGIQRVVLNIAKELDGMDHVHFVYCNSADGRWYVLDGIEFKLIEDLKIFNLFNDNWKISKIKWSYTRNKLREVRGVRKVKYLARFLKSRLLRSLLKKRGNLLGVSITPLEQVMHEGDLLLVPSIPNVELYKKSMSTLLEKLHVIYFFHDIIPVVAPEFVWKPERQNFAKYVELMHQTASLLITSAKYNVGDFISYIKNAYQEEPKYPIEAIGLPVDFDVQYSEDDYDIISPMSRRLSHSNYCLCVGSVGPRKNHFELLQAWKKFYDSDDYNNEVLVVAGAPWASAPDIVSVLRSQFCGGSVLFIESPSDKELAFLYDHCKFTVCLSLYEGWGLPVSESLAVGKPVIILDETTLTEAGYGVANVVKSRNLQEMKREITLMFSDEDYYNEALIKVKNIKSKLPTWREFSQKLLIAINKNYSS